MGRFSDAKANSDNPTVIRKALNYLAELLDRGYETKLTIAGKKIIISINPKDGISITVDGVVVFGIDSTGNVLISSSGTTTTVISGGKIEFKKTDGTQIGYIDATSDTVYYMAQQSANAHSFWIDIPGAGLAEIFRIRNGSGVRYRCAMTDGSEMWAPIKIWGLSTYANNAAAIAGGLEVGDIYSTGGDPDSICIVH